MAKYQKKFKKITPFRFPIKFHERTEQPPELKNYGSYKPFLQKEFKNKCVYCRKSDTLQDTGSFHVDHYRPKDKFPHLISNYSNLYYSCAVCNRYKGNYWSDQEGEKIVNPCDFKMSEQLKFKDENIIPLTNSGDKTVKKLRLNNDESVKYRKLMQAIINEFLATISQYDMQRKKAELEDSIIYLAQLIGEDPDTVKSALNFPVN